SCFADDHQNKVLVREVSVDDSLAILQCDRIQPCKEIVDLMLIETKEIELGQQRGQVISRLNLRRELSLQVSPRRPQLFRGQAFFMQPVENRERHVDRLHGAAILSK